MEDEKNLAIHETAFVTSTFRSFNESLSKDHFAKLWSNPKNEKWIQAYLCQVSSEEAHAHCLRNRFFLDTLKKLIEDNEIEVLINFGCGFSMYPFLLEEKLIHIEIDKPEIINYKVSKISDWQRAKKLPKRYIHFISVDFTESYQQTLFTQIDLIKMNKPCFILIEGVLFFLNRAETDSLFNFFDSIQNKGDFIGSASFQDTLKKTMAFQKLMAFLNSKMVETKETDYQTVQDIYYQSKPGYSLMDHQDYFSLSKRYGNRIQLNEEEILNEHFYILKKTT